MEHVDKPISKEGFVWNAEQLAVLDHDLDRHALVLAGPGTGKSTVVIALAERVARSWGPLSVRLATFTRAATAELASKAVEGQVQSPVTTVHSFALQILRVHPQWNRLPLPIRIPDDWETSGLILADLRDRLAGDGWNGGLRRSKVARLVREMAAQWESLEPDLVLEADVDPEFRNAFLRRWQGQRAVFGYSLFAEMPWYAFELLEDHPDADLGELKIAVIDEYQDLNPSELRLIRAIAERGITVIAIGDDEQSIYSWRMAAPQGIRDFMDQYEAAVRHPLTECHRFGPNILRRSQDLIETSPHRIPDRPPLRPSDGIATGEFAYLRFATAEDERDGVVALLRRHVSDGVDPSRIAVLTRSDFRGAWTKGIRERLEELDIPVRNIETAVDPLNTAEARETLAACRLLVDERDDLAWWTFLKHFRGCSDTYIRLAADSALEAGLRFHERLQTLDTNPLESGSAVAANAARRAIERIEALRREIDPEAFDSPREAVLGVAEHLDNSLDEALLTILDEAEVQFEEAGLSVGQFLGQLEPVAKDLALRAGGIALMKIASSKGLTFDVTATIGVDEQIFSSPVSYEHEELRRLLYVAMTRARLACYLSMATDRSGDATAYSFDGTPTWTRSRSSFLSGAGIPVRDGETYLHS